MPQQAMPASAVTDDTLRDFLARIAPVRDQLEELVLFGSRARGDARSDSDYDLLVVVPRRTDPLLDALYDAVMGTLLATGRLVSLKVVPGAELARLRALSTPFVRRVLAEGVRLG